MPSKIKPLFKFGAKAFRKVGNMIDTASEKIFPEEIKRNDVIADWFSADGDRTLRVNYLLDPNSVVFDLGGYKGEWARDIFCKYQCNIYIFEPVPEFFNSIKSYFRPNNKIKAYEFGLGAKDQTLFINIDANSSSVLKSGGDTIEIKLKNIKSFITENEIDNIDLIKINIEGAEYELLEAILAEGLITKFNNIQVQFHDFFPGAKERMDKIKAGLALTHTPTYQFEFVWENWRKK